MRTWTTDPLPISVQPIVDTLVEYMTPVIERMEYRLSRMEMQLQELKDRTDILIESHKTMNEVQTLLLDARNPPRYQQYQVN